MNNVFFGFLELVIVLFLLAARRSLELILGGVTTILYDMCTEEFCKMRIVPYALIFICFPFRYFERFKSE